MKIKCIITALLISVFAINLVGQNVPSDIGIITIKGKIDGIQSGKLLFLSQTGEKTVDTLGTSVINPSSVGKGGNFKLVAMAKEPVIGHIVVEGYSGGFLLLGEPGVVYDANLTNDSSAYIRGGKLQDDYHNYLKISNKYNSEIIRLNKKYKELKNGSKFRSASHVNDSLQSQIAERKQSAERFFGSHDDLITAYTYLLNAQMGRANLVKTEELYNELGPGARASIAGRILKQRIESLGRTERKGAKAPDFVLRDINGNDVRMSEVKAKIKIIDFWASWCGPCRRNNPSLVKLYEDFHDKGLEIIGISLDEKESSWKKAVQHDGLTWLQLSSLKGWQDEVAISYNVKAIPTMFVLDSKNRIIATGLKGETLYNFVNERLSKQDKVPANQYVIKGNFSRDSLRFTPEVVKEVYLKRLLDGQMVVIDTAKVVNKSFEFRGRTPEEIEMYYISGFDNGEIQVFLEDGQIEINNIDASFPVAAKVLGTENNNLFTEFVSVLGKANEQGRVRMQEMMDGLPQNIKDDSKLSQPYHKSVFHSNNVYSKVALLDFLQKHMDSVLSLYIVKYNIIPMFSTKIVERHFLRAMSSDLESHPLYKEIQNELRAADMKVGSMSPDITGKTVYGNEVSLSDLKGKYVLIDFWASWCAPCRREFPFLKKAMALSDNYDNFVLLSFSLDNKRDEWINGIEKNDLKNKNWIHISDLKGWNSKQVQLFNVKGVPYTILVNPKGQIVAFELRGEQMFKKVKDIMEGNVSYD